MRWLSHRDREDGGVEQFGFAKADFGGAEAVARGAWRGSCALHSPRDTAPGKFPAWHPAAAAGSSLAGPQEPIA
ncbi:hypothetical protein GCM10010345_19560 [Streptomyces canarius]|uniref:Uncharacterized protein n=1 Tax=Streptomyces canarius TaxID=285453 RepID=A0ABQ3CJX7_9ACTN|nr:hypothetical protein GCM10010345_19560 [Streptomyces canarius]